MEKMAKGQWSLERTLAEALDEVVAEWDAARAEEDHRTGITQDTGGIALARIALARWKAK